MSLIQEAIAAKLLATSAITSVVSTRIRPVAKRQADAMPYILYQQNAIEEIDTHGGACEYSKSYIQIDCWASTKAQALALCKSVRTALNHYTGSNASIYIASCFHQDTQDLTQPTAAGDETPEYVMSSVYKILFREV